MKKTVLLVGALVFIGLVGFCAIGSALMKSSPTADHTTSAPESSSPSQQRIISTGKPVSVPTISGDDLVHVGQDIPAGIYRADRKIESGENCYWSKSNDSEGRDIVSNGAPEGGKPQVTLKKGQWFSSSDCPTWVKQ